MAPAIPHTISSVSAVASEKYCAIDRVLRQQSAGNPAKQRAAAPHDDRKAFDDREEQGAARNDDGYADRKPEPEQKIIAFGRRRDRNHIVEAHHDVGDDDNADRAPQILDCFRRVFGIVRLRRNKLDGNPEQREPARELEIRQLHQCRDDTGKQNEQYGGRAGTEDHAPEPLLRRKRADGERNHDRIVAGQENIDSHDLQRGQARMPGASLRTSKHPRSVPLVPSSSFAVIRRQQRRVLSVCYQPIMPKGRHQ